MNKKTINEILESLRSASSILITAHEDPDGDSIGGQLASYNYLKSLGKNVVIYNTGIIKDRYKFLDGIENIKTDLSDYDFDPDLVLVLEATQLDRIGAVSDLIEPGCAIVNIDHHTGNSGYGDINLVDSSASSVCEMIYRILKSTGYIFNKSTAEMIYTGILTDTGRFHFSSTTPESLRISAELIEAGVNPRELTDKIYFSMSQPQMQIIGEVMCNAELALDRRLCAFTLTREMLRRRHIDFSDIEGLVEYSVQLKGVIIGVLFKEVSDSCTRVSLRSRANFDVAMLAGKYGGGGHVNAAGMSVELPLDQAKATLLQAAEEMLNHYEE